MSWNWEIGQVKENWEICKIFGGPGKSGMGIVYLVRDLQVRSREMFYAAKTFQEENLARNESVVKAFARESLAWIRLDLHPNLVTAYFLKIVEDRPLLFLEFVTGGDLHAKIRKGELRGDTRQTLALAINFCDGMVQAVRNGMKVHRDVKPANCLITEQGILQITDFGMAKILDAASEAAAPQTGSQSPVDLNMTRTGTMGGTVPYMAPEQFEDMKRVDTRADIYSFGVMLYEMLTGRRPFEAYNAAEMFIKHKTAPRPVPEGADPALAQFVARCMASETADRFQSFEEVREALAALYQQLAGHAPAPVAVAAYSNCIRYVQKGFSLRRLGFPDEALLCYQKALEKVPGFPDGHFNMAQLLAGLKRFEEALPHYDAALENTRNFLLLRDASHEKLAEVMGLPGNVSAGGAMADSLRTLAESEWKMWLGRALTLQQLGRYEEAIQSTLNALKLNAASRDAWGIQGQCWLQLEKLDLARDCFLRAGDAEGLDFIAREFIRARRYKDALACATSAIEFKPGDPNLWFMKGLLHADAADWKNALDSFTNAARLGHPEAAQHIAACRARLGR